MEWYEISKERNGAKMSNFRIELLKPNILSWTSTKV